MPSPDHPDDEWDENADDEDSEEAFSLDELGAAYARLAGGQPVGDSSQREGSADQGDGSAPEDAESSSSGGDPSQASAAATDPSNSDGDASLETAGERAEGESEHDEVSDLVTPEAIIEAALFVGHPENKPLTEQRLASLMRGVSPEEVIQFVDQLNDSYRSADQGLRILREENGFRMSIAPEVEIVRRSFLGKVREARLNQAAIEVLALVAYQPGTTAQQVQDQRGRESHSLLNQLVRRQLLMIERRKPEDGGRAVAHYYPTERFLVLFGLESLEDLPHVEEGLREV